MRSINGIPRLAAGAAAVVMLHALPPGRVDAAPGHDIVVTSTAELEAALAPANAGATILVTAGEYDLGHPLTVPQDAKLLGEGVMLFDESGLPTGFEPSGRTLLRA